jgi:tetratricopeptide (TPR) repeat protein
MLVHRTLPLAADSPSTLAKTNYDRGLDLVREQRFDEAIPEFERAYSIKQHHAPLLAIASCYEQLADLSHAAKYLQRYLDEGGSQIPDAKRATHQAKLSKWERQLQRAEEPESAAAMVTNINSSVPIQVECPLSDVSLHVDGRLVAKSPLPASLHLPPGEHAVEFWRAGHAWDRHRVSTDKLRAVTCRHDQRTTAIGAATETASAQNDSMPEADSRGATRVTGTVVGAVGLALTSVSTGLAIWNDLQAREWQREDRRLEEFRACAPVCASAPPDNFSGRQAANNQLAEDIRDRELAWILIGASGLSLIGVGTYLFLSDKEVSAQTSLRVSPTGLQLAGHW